jgi:hypothetical protein
MELKMNNLSVIQKIIDSDYLLWPSLYDNIDQILGELENELNLNNGLLTNDIKNRIFWFFRNFFSNSEKKLSDAQAKQLYHITSVILFQNSNLIELQENELSILEDILIVVENLIYLHPDLNSDITLLNPLIKTASLKKELKFTKNASAFISALFHCFTTHLKKIQINSSRDLLDLIEPLQLFLDKQLIWSKNDPTGLLVKGLLFLQELRVEYQDNQEILRAIDDYVLELSNTAIKRIPKTFPDYSVVLIKEDIGATYTRHIDINSRNSFKEISIVLYPKDILPQIEVYTLSNTYNLPRVQITINHAELTPEKKNKMIDLIETLHSEMEDFISYLNIKSLEKERINIELNLFNNRNHFDRYGYLVWNIDSSGGGITLPGIDNQPTTAFVYQTEFGFENLKHELTHAFMNLILGGHYSAYLPGVFTEGLADFFDKGKSNLNKLIQMQQYLLREPLKPLPDIVTLNKGGTVVYLYGYFWISYLMDEMRRTILADIFNQVQHKNQDEVNRLIKQYGISQADDFNHWIKNELSQLLSYLFNAVYEQDVSSFNQLLANMDSELINTQELSSKNTPLHVAIEIWMQQKNDSNEEQNKIALTIIWSLLLKGAELKTIKNLNDQTPFDLIESDSDRRLIENYEKDAKNSIYLENRVY